tara:strand:- start:451 stop:1020 length:570 start_codon:yes stop_codon:yes gene_type:complete
MQKPGRPVNEKSRLEALRSLRLLDTVPEFRFDRITKLSRILLDVPIAVISLVDENRQWFKSKQGLDACETSREISFCGHAILQNDALIITDATKDIRFKDNPLVTNEPHIRFYCGMPITTGSGEQIGTLCVIDQKPREFGSNEIEIMNNLAALVNAEIAIIESANIENKLSKALNTQPQNTKEQENKGR